MAFGLCFEVQWFVINTNTKTMGYVNAGLEKMILVNFHYVINNISSDWLTSENDPALEELLSNGFDVYQDELDKGLTIFLQSDTDIYQVSRITNFPHFISLRS